MPVTVFMKMSNVYVLFATYLANQWRFFGYHGISEEEGSGIREVEMCSRGGRWMAEAGSFVSVVCSPHSFLLYHVEQPAAPPRTPERSMHPHSLYSFGYSLSF